MSRCTLGVLFSDARGKIGGAVLSKWRGINTIRSRVTPANPQSVGQVAQRLALAICTASWKSLNATFQGLWNTHASGKRYSGFNLFGKQNIAQERTDNYREVSPAEPDNPQIAAFTPATGISGQINVTWTAGTAADDDEVFIFSRKAETGALTMMDAITVVTGTATITDLEAGEDYVVYGVVHDITGLEYSSTNYGTATAGA